MKQFIVDVLRGILVGLIVWYILRPDEPAFDRLAEAVEEGKEISASFIDISSVLPDEYLNYPMEQILMAGGFGALLGIVFWIIRSKTKSKSKPSTAASKKSGSREKKK